MQKSTIAYLLFSLACFCTAQAQSSFAQKNISIGVVVSDLEASLKFYKEVIGMQETGAFTVNTEMSRRTGLTGGKAFDVKVLQLANDPKAGQWKLMSFNKKAKKKKKYIQNGLGMRYITIYVKDITPVMEALNNYKVPILSEAPTPLDDGQFFLLVQDPDGIFIELIGPKL